ncbi:MAG: UDP-N-acetylmuramoyl-tripeptide--D-alanyl-D-alanine ligase [Bacteroidetes bacterium HGW-Bacteroidetes-6]|jgi:UDP-N-acetylmuramoyl-tripeptide--D-alanyl-D-alanine ligase|nr:MAG: UDP-N-acetylmuramoyl-tripeptide--D-alanyl-D-alanine ligase [Bacteroidetes bacterium HGW-Bacteroidetes-6]
MEVNTLYQKFCNSAGVSTDTRSFKRGMIFVALKGESFDANTMVDIALRQGASAVITQNPAFSNHPDCYYCNDSLTALQELALLHRKQLKAIVIAITGTNGKTTTKELMRETLSTAGKVQATEGNLNNHIGVPLTLLKIKNDTNFAIIEMGANHPGEIDFLCKIALPDYGLITNIGRAHLEGFGNFDGVVQTKTELYRHIAIHGKAIFVNEDDSLLLSLSEEQKRILYGTTAFSVKTAELHNPLLEFGWTYNDKVYQTKTQLIGEYNTPNILASIAAGLYFGGNPNNIHLKLQKYTPGNMRSQWIDTGRNKLILDAYNANPSSMAKALTNFDTLKGFDKIAILGDMLELGIYSAEEHQNILKLLSTLNVKKAVLIGPEFMQWEKSYSMFDFFINTNEAIQKSKLNDVSNCLMLLKGSRGIGVERIKNIL